MKRHEIWSLLFIVVMFVAVGTIPAAGQDQEMRGQNTADSQPLPEALSRLFRLDGYWEAPVTLMLEGKTYQFKYMCDFSRTADGSGMFMREWFDSPELGSMRGDNLAGYNANDGKIHWFSVDNFGTCHEHLGEWETADRFVMNVSENMEGKKFHEVFAFEFTAPDRVEVHGTASIDGQKFQDIRGTFVRMERPKELRMMDAQMAK